MQNISGTLQSMGGSVRVKQPCGAEPGWQCHTRAGPRSLSRFRLLLAPCAGRADSQSGRCSRHGAGIGELGSVTLSVTRELPPRAALRAGFEEGGSTPAVLPLCPGCHPPRAGCALQRQHIPSGIQGSLSSRSCAAQPASPPAGAETSEGKAEQVRRRCSLPPLRSTQSPLSPQKLGRFFLSLLLSIWHFHTKDMSQPSPGPGRADDHLALRELSPCIS